VIVEPVDRWALDWLTVNEAGEDAVLVTIEGGSAAGRSYELWAAVQGAFEVAASRLVVIDMRLSTGFDLSTLSALSQLASVAVRWRVDFCALLRPNSPLEQYSRCLGLDRTLPIFPTLPAALAASAAGMTVPGSRRAAVG
jgi:hypothetical protein